MFFTLGFCKLTKQIYTSISDMSAKVLLTESMSLEMGAQEPWPTNVQLFQPYEAGMNILQ